MNHKTLLALYGLKYNPFQPELPAEALWPIPGTETFARKLEMLVAPWRFCFDNRRTWTWKIQNPAVDRQTPVSNAGSHRWGDGATAKPYRRFLPGTR